MSREESTDRESTVTRRVETVMRKRKKNMPAWVEGIKLLPKQQRAINGPGSLIRMTFEVYRLAGQCYGSITPDGEHSAPTVREQISALSVDSTLGGMQLF